MRGKHLKDLLRRCLKARAAGDDIGLGRRLDDLRGTDEGQRCSLPSISVVVAPGAHLCLQAVVGDIGAVSIGGHQEATGNVEAGARHVGEGAACCRARVSRQPAGVACGARARCIFRAPLPPTLSSAFCSVSSGTHVLPVLAEAQVRTPRDTPAWMGRRRLLVAMFLLPRVPIGMQKDSQQTSTEQWIRSATINRPSAGEELCPGGF